MKKILCSVIVFLLMTIAFADAACPDIKGQPFCENGSWRVALDLQNGGWKIMGEGVTGKPCSPASEAHIVWRYAFYLRSTAGCNYALLDSNALIGPIQIKSYNHFPRSEYWEIGRPYYPGYKTCSASREKCTFRAS